VVYTSNIFAILGLRAMYFLLAGVMDRGDLCCASGRSTQPCRHSDHTLSAYARISTNQRMMPAVSTRGSGASLVPSREPGGASSAIVLDLRNAVWTHLGPCIAQDGSCWIARGASSIVASVSARKLRDQAACGSRSSSSSSPPTPAASGSGDTSSLGSSVAVAVGAADFHGLCFLARSRPTVTRSSTPRSSSRCSRRSTERPPMSAEASATSRRFSRRSDAPS